MTSSPPAWLAAGLAVLLGLPPHPARAQAVSPQLPDRQAPAPQAPDRQAPNLQGRAQPSPRRAAAVPPSPPVEQVVVVARTPVPGAAVDQALLPGPSLVLHPGDIAGPRPPSLTAALLRESPAISVNDVEGNPFQPDIIYRGFTASPTAGAAQGIAVYVNGARFNDGFGDAVNWDLLPPDAIASAAIQAANPGFGLNALGGALDVRLKTGFDAQGASFSAYGGSFGRAQASAQYGARAGNWAFFTLLDTAHDDGFRRTGQSDLYRLYSDAGWRADGREVHLGVIAASTVLGNPGATPVQALAADRASIFTAPNTVSNKYVAVLGNAQMPLGDRAALQASAYFQNLTQRIPNGITTDAAPCGDGSGLLCSAEGDVLHGRDGQPIPDFLNGGPYSGLSSQGLDSHVFGAALQATAQRSWAGMRHLLLAGASFDGSDSVFSGTQAIGGFDPYSRAYLGPGVVIDQPDAGINPVRVASATRDYALFAQDIITLLPRLDMTLLARWTAANIRLADKLGGPVSGSHDFYRINPYGGLAYHLTAHQDVFASYGQTSRTPTPQELSCASAATPCSLLNFFVGDPDLGQVVARSVTAGWRGRGIALGGLRLGWQADYFRTSTQDDLIYQPTAADPNLAFYTNAGATLRTGLEAAIDLDAARWHARIGYAFVDATFRDALSLNSPDNPAADANGQIAVRPGSHLPGVPRHRATLELSYDITGRVRIGMDAVLAASQYRFGDEANLTKPVGGYAVFGLNLRARITPHVEAFASAENIFDQRYSTYGGFGPVDTVPWPAVPGGVSDPRTASPGLPRAIYGGIRVKL